MTEEELRTIVDVGQEDGIIEDEERDMIHNVFDFGDAEAKEVMVPRIDMTFVHVDSTYDDLISSHSAIIVFISALAVIILLLYSINSRIIF